MAELSEYEKWLLGSGPGTGRYASGVDVPLPEESPISIGGYRVESLYPDVAPDGSQMVRAGYRIGDDYYVEPGIQRRESTRGPSTGRSMTVGTNPLGLSFMDIATPEGRQQVRGLNMGPMSLTRVAPEGGKPTYAMGGTFDMDPGQLQFEGSKRQQSVGYSTPLDLGILELLAMRDPQALSAFLRYKLNF